MSFSNIFNRFFGILSFYSWNFQMFTLNAKLQDDDFVTTLFSLSFCRRFCCHIIVAAVQVTALSFNYNTKGRKVTNNCHPLRFGCFFLREKKQTSRAISVKASVHQGSQQWARLALFKTFKCMRQGEWGRVDCKEMM